MHLQFEFNSVLLCVCYHGVIVAVCYYNFGSIHC